MLLSLALAACTSVSPTTALQPDAATVMTKATAPAVPMTGANTCNLPGLREAILKQVNAARAQPRSCGRRSFAAAAPISWSTQLFSAAARHSADMAQNNYFSHVSPGGSKVTDRVNAQGYPWSSVGENIAAGARTVDSVMTGWLQSEGHCANIMDPNFSEVAVACASRPDGPYRTYWTMVLGRPQSSKAPKVRPRGA